MMRDASSMRDNARNSLAGNWNFCATTRAETESGIAIAPEGIQRCFGGTFTDRRDLLICNAIVFLLR
jgi:hypothetical protein